jgi:hypothetical protein
LLGRLIANRSKDVQQKQVLPNERHRETFIGENELIGRPAKFDRTAAEPLKLPNARSARVDYGYLGRVNVPACDHSQTLQDKSNCKLGVLRSQKPWNADDVDLDHQVTAPSRHLYPDGFVYDFAVTSEERYRLAKVLRCGGEVEDQSQRSGIDLASEVETERRIVQRLSSKLQEPSLRGGGDAIFPLVQIPFGQADTLQQGRWVNIVLSKRDDRQSREEASRCRQQAGLSSGLSSVLP